MQATDDAATVERWRSTGARIVALDCVDVRFPTSLDLDGSDAMNPDPDYSAAYAVLRTDRPELDGRALSFTIAAATRSSSRRSRPCGRTWSAGWSRTSPVTSAVSARN